VEAGNPQAALLPLVAGRDADPSDRGWIEGGFGGLPKCC